MRKSYSSRSVINFSAPIMRQSSFPTRTTGGIFASSRGISEAFDRQSSSDGRQPRCHLEFPECEFQSASQIFEIGLAMALAVRGLVKGAGALSIDHIVAASLACDQGEIAESDARLNSAISALTEGCGEPLSDQREVFVCASR